jgi:hypothetical protein
MLVGFYTRNEMIQWPLFKFLADDHARLAALLQRAKSDRETTDYGTRNFAPVC